MNKGEMHLVKQIIEAETEKARIRLEEARARTARLKADIEALIAILEDGPLVPTPLQLQARQE
jgi:hypothetical protein